MPPSRKPRASKPSDPIALRIREAEKRLSPVRSDRIGYDEATYAKLADLEARGTRWSEIGEGPKGVRRVAVNRWDLRGIPIELEERPVVYRGSNPGRTA